MRRREKVFCTEGLYLCYTDEKMKFSKVKMRTDGTVFDKSAETERGNMKYESGKTKYG